MNTIRAAPEAAEAEQPAMAVIPKHAIIPVTNAPAKILLIQIAKTLAPLSVKPVLMPTVSYGLISVDMRYDKLVPQRTKCAKPKRIQTPTIATYTTTAVYLGHAKQLLKSLENESYNKK